VYKTIYGTACEFRLTPIAKMEIQTFDDLESAVRSGAVNMDMLANIAYSLSTDFPPPRCVLYQPLCLPQRAQNVCPAWQTPRCSTCASTLTRCASRS
jgi:hypothetical protein